MESSHTHAESIQTVSSSSNWPASLVRAKIWSTVSAGVVSLLYVLTFIEKLTERLRNKTIGSGLGGGGTAGEEVHLGSTRAVGERDRASEGDEVTGGDTVLLDEGLLQLHDLVETNVGVERGLDVVEDHDGAVSTSTTVVI